MTLVERIKKLCNDHKITLAELERKASLSNGTIRRWDEKTPGIDKLQAVADYFNVSTDYLLGREKETGELEAFFRLNTQDLNEEEKEQLQEELEEYMLFIKNKIKKRKDDLNG